MKKSVNQLIEWFEPHEYFLNLDARPGKKTFSGHVSIWGDKKRKFVRLHAKDLKISKATFHDKDSDFECEIIELENDEIELRPTKKTTFFNLEDTDLDGGITDEQLEKSKQEELDRRNGNCGVRLKFTGEIVNGKMSGLYPCFYEIDGERKTMLATQFESHHAREVFPCVDEPAAKAVFQLSVDTDPDLTALSNMPISHQSDITELNPDIELTQHILFEDTPKMSTYLLALVIGDLQKKTAKTKSGVEVNVFATLAQDPRSLDFALKTAAWAIDFFDDYFGIKYPLPKSDHVAIPDFSSGAMENWGLITYRETCLLASENSAISTKQHVAIVITHELSHQWFGNLVTMKWWDDLWLNESFASLMEHICADILFPNWDMWSSFETGDVIAALRRDALTGVQPVRQDVNHPDEILTLFDPAIVYAKGERLLKMLRAHIGEKAFRNGLREYFKKYAYLNTEANDLWRALSDSSGQNLSEIMTPWLTQPGFPIIFASQSGNKITLRQERFLLDGKSDSTIWPVILFSNDKSAPKIMTEKEITFTSKNPENFQLNVGNNSHFITAYDETLSKQIIKQIPKMSSVDRAKILNESLLLAQSGLQSTAAILDLLSVYADENDNAVWEIMALAIATIARFVEPDSDDEKRLKRLTGNLAKEQYKRLGWTAKKGESINDQKMRPMVISQMIYAEDVAAINRAVKIYIENKHDFTKINGDLRSVILTAAIRHGGAEEFDYLLDIYKISQDADLKQEICGAMTSTHNQSQIDRILDFLNKLNIIKPQDLPHWFAWMLGNRRARRKTWNWTKENWAWVKKTFGGDKSYDVFPRYAGARLSTRNELTEFNEFFADKIDDLALKRAIEVGHNDILTRVEWIERDRDEVLEKLKEVIK